MKDNTHIIDVDIKNENYINEPVVRKNDDVKFTINISDDGEPFDLSGVTKATISCERYDGTAVISKPGALTSDSKVTFTVPKSSIALVGRVVATVHLYGSSNRVSTISFNFNVVKDPTGFDYMPEDEQSMIEVALGEGPLIIQAAQEATGYANLAADEAAQEADRAKVEADRAKIEADYVEGKRPLIDKSIADSSAALGVANGIDAKATESLVKSEDAKTTAETVRDEFDQVIAEAGDNNPEVVQARGGEVNLNARLNKTTTQLAEKANQADVTTNLNALDKKVSSQISGSPKGVYSALSELQTAYPLGAEGIYVTTSNNNWYFWDGSNWVSGGAYQSVLSSDFPAVNLIANGDFKTPDLSGLAGSIFANLSVDDGKLKAVVASLVTSSRIETTKIPIIPNHSYYLKADVKSEFSVSTYFTVGSSAPYSSYNIADKKTRISAIVKARDDAPIRLYHRVADGHKVGDVYYIHDFIAIDLTETFGLGNEPNAKQMDDIMSKYRNYFFNGAVSPLVSTKTMHEELIYLNELSGINSFTTIPTFSEGLLNKVEQFDGSAIKSRTTLTYNTDRQLILVIEETKSHTIKTAINYFNGEYKSSEKTVTKGGI